MDLLTYFDKVYCINLDKRPDRYSSVQKEFEKYNITGIERYIGVDGNSIINTSTLLNGEIGILQTHLNIIKKCKEENIQNVLILEDDVCFTDEILKLNEYMNKVPSDWDFIYFGGNHVYGKPPLVINEKILKLNFTVALHCVAIKHTVFDTIISILPHQKRQVDGYYGQLQSSFNGYCFYPNMAIQSSGFSDIQNKNVDYNHFFK